MIRFRNDSCRPEVGFFFKPHQTDPGVVAEGNILVLSNTGVSTIEDIRQESERTSRCF